MKDPIFKTFISKILSHQKIAVFSHVRPDGDCLGAQVAMSLWLQKNGKEAEAFNEDAVPENMEWLTEFFPITAPSIDKMKNFDAFVILDGNALHRFGETAESLADLDKPIFMIDHHPDPDDVFEEFVSRESASSTCELIYALYTKHNPDQIDEQAARAMYLGLVTDTASFQFNSVKPNTLKAGADLLDRGEFTPDEVVERIYSSRPLRQLKLLSKALDTIKIHAEGIISTIEITKEMLTNTGCTKEDTEGFVQYPLSIKGVKACVLFREQEKGVKLSLRSKSDDINVNEWAKKFNGGGHKRAAGAWYDGSMENALKAVLAAGTANLKS